MATRDELVSQPRSGVTAGAGRPAPGRQPGDPFRYATPAQEPAGRTAGPSPGSGSGDRPRPRRPPRSGVQAGRSSYYAPRRPATAPSRQLRLSGGPSYRYQAADGRQVTVAAPARTYHRIVLAEFAACVVLIAASPVLTPRTTTNTAGQAAVDTSVSLAGPLVRLTAVSVVFFVLALMASGQKTGKIAAAFGGLVLLGTLLNATDMIAALARVFGAGQKQPAPAPAAPSRPSPSRPAGPRQFITGGP